MARKMYEGWTNREWNLVNRALNKELPPEKCGVKLSKEEKEQYLKDLEFLKEARAKSPFIPIEFDTDGTDWK